MTADQKPEAQAVAWRARLAWRQQNGMEHAYVENEKLLAYMIHPSEPLYTRATLDAAVAEAVAKERERVLGNETSMLRLLVDLRFALGDDGKRMQSELVAFAAELRKEAERYRWLQHKAPGEIVFDHTRGQIDGGSRFVLCVPFDGEPINNDEESAARLNDSIDAAIRTAQERT